MSDLISYDCKILENITSVGYRRDRDKFWRSVPESSENWAKVIIELLKSNANAEMINTRGFRLEQIHCKNWECPDA